MVGIITFVYVAFLVHSTKSVRFQVNVDYFDIKVVDNDAKKTQNTLTFRTSEDDHLELTNTTVDNSKEDTEEKTEDKIVFENGLKNSELKARVLSDNREQIEEDIKKNWTADFGKRCLYQYPDEKQVNSVLSTMMYDLINVFLEANEMITQEVTKRSRKMPNAEGIRSALLLRYEVAHKKRRTFLDNIYKNLTTEIRRFYENKIPKEDSTDRDSCPPLDKVKEMWRPLLESSLMTLKDVMHHCAEDYLKDQMIDPESNLGSKVNTYLHDQMNDVQSKQLNILCDNFNICN